MSILLRISVIWCHPRGGTSIRTTRIFNNIFYNYFYTKTLTVHIVCYVSHVWIRF